MYAAIAESLASYGTAVAVSVTASWPPGLSNQTSFLRPITEGTIEAVATRHHRGRTTWVWEVEISDAQGRLCVLSRVTIRQAAAPDPGRPGAPRPSQYSMNACSCGSLGPATAIVCAQARPSSPRVPAR